MDGYTLAEQMGASVKMIWLHYGHLKPAMKTDLIARCNEFRPALNNFNLLIVARDFVTCFVPELALKS